MRHWNGNLLCAISIRVSGDNPFFHEIHRLCILPLDSNVKPLKEPGILPFDVYLRPDHPERIDDKVLKRDKKDWFQAIEQGVDREDAKDLLENWINKLRLDFTKWGTRKRLIALAHDYATKNAYIRHWLGPDLYDHWFHEQYRDPMVAALYINDRAGRHAERPPFPKLPLTHLCSALDIERDSNKDLLIECRQLAEVYERMLITNAVFFL